jgi:hypothetical protein
MLETIQKFESVMGPATWDYPLYVIGAGSAAVVIGLFVWLAGLGFKKILMAIIGAAGGAALGYFAIGRGVIPAAVSAVVAAVIAVIFERVFIALFEVILVVGFGLAILIGPYLNNGQAEPETQDAINSDESVEQPKTYLFEIGGKVKGACSEMPVYKWLIVTALTVTVLVAGFVFQRLAAASCFSILGTLLMAAGMILLLLYKGAAPLSRVGNRPLMYAGIFAGMAAFGTVEQLLFCRGGLIKPTKKAQAEGAGAGKKKRRSDRVAT